MGSKLLGGFADGLVSFFMRSPIEVVRDCVDIGVVAILIYWGLLILRGTRAMQMAFGLVLVLVAYVAASIMHLLTLGTLLDNIVSSMLLIAVVVFQNDIRRALVRVGARSFRWSRTDTRDSQAVEEIIRAATQLAAKRIGALIVIEQVTGLEEFAESGVEIDARVSRELLYALFVPSYENPTHDGAVIIRDGRVWKAGVFLPIGAQAADRTLGARHRAGLALAAETDALVVVVSEERGKMSLCFEGNIVRNLDADSMREALGGLLYSAALPGEKKEVEV